MSSISKFTVFLALVGVLAVLFAFVPGDDAKKCPFSKPELPAIESERPAPRVQKRSTAETRLAEAPNGATMEGKISFSAVKVPAIRGQTNYGWIQLPRGTKVDLVRATGDSLWVRWDGTTVKVPQVAAATGAVVVR